MKISLLITTYERPDALRTVLQSVLGQTRLPDEVVVGDDGSGPETAEVIRAAGREGRVPVRHCWLEHDGFRAGRMRNCAAAAAGGEYFVMIDDDILLHPRFIADHEAAAEKGFFVQGTRALLDAAASARVLAGGPAWPGLLSRGAGNRKNLLRSPLLSGLFRKPVTGLRGIRTCNFALWRADMVRVNGFSEDFVGWGREDSEFAGRLLKAGVRRRDIRFAALGCHLHHPPRSRDGLAANDARLAASSGSDACRCERGLNLHMKDS